MMDVEHETQGQTVIRVDGTFDGQAAARLSTRLGELGAGDGLVIDFAHVEEFHDLGLATVARELAGHSGLRVRGLARHQLRLLRYWGIDVGAEGGEADV